MSSARRNFSQQSGAAPPRSAAAVARAASVDDRSLIQEFILALAEEIDAIKKGRGGSIVTVYDGVFVRREGPLFVYVFTTESPLIVMDDAPAEVAIGSARFAGQIISVQGSEVAVGIEHDFGQTITKARLITNLWYLLEALRKRYEEVLNGERALDSKLALRLFGFASATVGLENGELNLPISDCQLNDEQRDAIRRVFGSDVHFIWGPPGTGKTQMIGFLIAALVRQNLRVLVASHTNVATDHAIRHAAELMKDSEDYHSGKLVRFGNKSGNVELPPMVDPEKIVEKLGKALRDRVNSLNRELTQVRLSLGTLREIEVLLARRDAARRAHADLAANLERSTQEQFQATAREKQLSNDLSQIKVKLNESLTAGKVKRFFYGLNPEKLQIAAARIETEIGVLRRGAAARVSKQNELRSAITRAHQDQAKAETEGERLLSRHGVSPATLETKIAQAEEMENDLLAQIRTIEAELEALLAKVLREAKVIATSLTKATISKQLDDQSFDALVIDEASMAPMPSVYFAASRASKKAIIVGDFRQLPPICKAEQETGCEMARKWLARDIFNQAGIQQAVDQGRPEARVTMLRRQYRMHPEISRLPNAIVYGGKLIDSVSDTCLQETRDFLEKSPLGDTPLAVYDVSSVNPWSSRLEQGGRYNLYSAVVSTELARRAVQAGIEDLGIISPYAVQARLIKMMLDDTGDTKLRRIKVSTVHRFQGLEEEAIIFDVAEGPMPRYGPSGLVDGTDLTSQAAKLINVSITRPKSQLAIVANLKYLKSKLSGDAVLIRVLNESCERGRILDSRTVVDGFSCAELERWAALLDPHDDKIDPNDSALYTERNFYAAFFADLRKAKREIIIVSPFLTASRAQQFLNLFRSKNTDDVDIRVFTRTLREQQGDMFRQAELVFEEFKRVGIEIVERRGLHEKFAFIDREIAWEGSLNILSQSEGRSTEHMRRLPFARTCEELITLHKFGSEAEVEPGTRRPIQTDRKCACGHPMVLKRGPHGVFVGCSNYPRCREHYSIRRGDSLRTDVACPGRDGTECGQPMLAVRARYGVYLKCSDPNCKGTRNVGHN
ncbi:MAG TPA: AAA domain-containing protein [Terriglobales bacterium]|nr:AAA domain-containing protein [Terriglobales bacterium]